MLKTARQFKPESQIDSAIGELENVMLEAVGTLERLHRLKSSLTAEVEQLRSERDALEIFTEEEAAMLLKIDTESPARAKKHLGNLRRSMNLPHLSFGTKPRYTRAHLIQICSIFEISPPAAIVGRKAA